MNPPMLRSRMITSSSVARFVPVTWPLTGTRGCLRRSLGLVIQGLDGITISSEGSSRNRMRRHPDRRDGGLIFFAGPYAINLLDRQHENLSVTDRAGAGPAEQRVDRGLDEVI